MTDVVDTVGLPHLGSRLDSAEVWDKSLSEGEKQRLARALLYRPDLLLMDEATAALDEPSEVALHQMILSHLPTATILTVSHRSALSALYGCSIEMGVPSSHISRRLDGASSRKRIKLATLANRR